MDAFDFNEDEDISNTSFEKSVTTLSAEDFPSTTTICRDLKKRERKCHRLKYNASYLTRIPNGTRDENSDHGNDDAIINKGGTLQSSDSVSVQKKYQVQTSDADSISGSSHHSSQQLRRRKKKIKSFRTEKTNTQKKWRYQNGYKRSIY
jgi:hypothetical protein